MNETEHVVAGVGDLADGEMKAVTVGETLILLARVDGAFYAVGGECPHYHGQLAEGVLSGTRVVCPLHQACFDVRTGAMLEPPALDDLPRYEVRVAGGRVSVVLPAIEPTSAEPASDDDTKDGRIFVIVGGGAAGNIAASTLRDEGFRGRIVMITPEDRLPYDRPNLSKDYLAGNALPEWMPLRSDEYYEQLPVEVLRGRWVETLDASSKTIVLDDGTSLHYSAALVATGGVARRPPIPGIDLGNVFTLRSFDDADAIVGAIEGSSRAVVVGASFIGMEAAASLVARGLSVTVVAPTSVPFEHTLGEEIGGMFQALHERSGVRFELGSAVTSFEGDGDVATVVLENGVRLDADLVVVGAGVSPATGFVRGISLHDDGSVVVDRNLRATDGLYAAGDVARFPDPRTGELVRIEHWRTAEQHGRIAARNMAGRPTAYTGVPFFWTNQFGTDLHYVGHAAEWDELIVDGDLAANDYMALYVKKEQILAAAGSGRDAQMGAFAEALRLDRLPSIDAARRGGFDWVAHLKEG